MKPNIQQIKAQLLETTPESIVEMLYEYYRDINRPETDAIKEDFAQLSEILSKLPLREMDEVWYRICDLCIAYQKLAFTDGVGIGAKLVLELEAH